MSESCPNCDLGFRMFQPSMGTRITVFQCGSCVDPEAGGFIESTACVLIRSLREELAEARADNHGPCSDLLPNNKLGVAVRIYPHGLYCDDCGEQAMGCQLMPNGTLRAFCESHNLVRDAERDQIADFLAERGSTMEADSIRDNEHRSNG